MSDDVFDPAFDDPFSHDDIGDVQWDVFSGVTYDKQVLVHSALLARWIHLYMPYMAGEIKWNPWDVDGFMNAASQFIEEFDNLVPSMNIVDSFSDAVGVCYVSYTYPQGFNENELSETEFISPLDISRYLYAAIQMGSESHTSEHETAAYYDILLSKNLPIESVYDYFNEIIDVVDSRTRGIDGSIDRMKALLLTGGEMDKEWRLLQFKMKLLFCFHSTGIPLIDVNHDSYMATDDPLYLHDEESVRWLIEQWDNASLYLDMIESLSQWTCESAENLDFILDVMREAHGIWLADGLAGEEE